MSILTSFTRAVSGVAAACSILIAAAPAHAAVIASFDPAFGPGIPGLGFRGTIALDVSSGCYANGPGLVFTDEVCQITVADAGAHIDFYNLSDNAVLSFVDLPGTFFDPGYIFAGYIDPLTNQLVGFDSNDSGRFDVTVGSPIDYDGNMRLYFESGHAFSARSAFSTNAVGQVVDPAAGAFLINCNPSDEDEAGCDREVGDVSNKATVTITAVPEPEPMALALIGVGALAVVRRRRRSIGR